MIEYGNFNVLRIAALTEYGAALTDGESRVLLPRKYVPEGARAGDELQVFVYFDSEDRPVATTRLPKGCAGDIVRLKVVSLTPLGAFLDWGLEKDLFVPFKEMKNKKMTVGEEYAVLIRYDEVSRRLIGSNRFDRLWRDSDPSNLQPGHRVSLVVCSESGLGYQVLVNRRFCGMLYHSEVFQKLQVADQLDGFVVKVREDGKVDVRLREDGRKGVLKEVEAVFRKLEDAGGFLPYDAKTPADVIASEFHMSRKMFKEILGHLYKNHRIELVPGGIRSTGK